MKPLMYRHLPKTVDEVRNAREQLKCGGHPTVTCEFYRASVDVLLREIRRYEIVTRSMPKIEAEEYPGDFFTRDQIPEVKHA